MAKGWNDFNAAISTFNSNGVMFQVSSISDTPNPQDVIMAPVGAFYYYYRTLTTVATLFNICVTGYNVRVTSHIFERKFVKPFSLSAISLYCALCGNLCRLVCFIDPYAFYGIINLSIYEVFNSLNDSFHVLGSLVSIVVWTGKKNINNIIICNI